VSAPYEETFVAAERRAHGLVAAPSFDDNPATIDQLGFSAIVAAVAPPVTARRLNPSTVGVNSPWGGGKSTVRKSVHLLLKDQSGVIVVEVDPWEVVDSGDARGTLIARALDELNSRLTADAEHAEDAENNRFETSAPGPTEVALPDRRLKLAAPTP
jgi:predicted KAP-like P-loop ATPase